MRAKIRCAEIVKILLRGNKSKLAVLSATERFRCHSLACGQVRCQGFACGRFRCFLDLPGLCGQVGCSREIGSNMQTAKQREMLFLQSAQLFNVY